MDEFYRKFSIDDYLKRYPKAIRNLSNAGISSSSPFFFKKMTSNKLVFRRRKI